MTISVELVEGKSNLLTHSTIYFPGKIAGDSTPIEEQNEFCKVIAIKIL